MAQAIREVRIPDIGDFTDIAVIDVVARPGDKLAAEDPLITLESDKATMDIPAPFPGVVAEIKVKVGDKVSKGSLIALFESSEPVATTAAPAVAAAPAAAPPAAAPPVAAPPAAAPPAAAPPAAAPPAAAPPAAAPPAAAPPAATPPAAAPVTAPAATPAPSDNSALPPHASPSVRRYARELGVDLTQVTGTGRKNRIQQEDVNAYVKGVIRNTAAPAPAAVRGGFALPEAPAIDFAAFGAIETKPLSKIRRLTGQNLHRSWITVPHVTQFNEADVTDLESFRAAKKAEADQAGVKLTMLSFLMKACVAALRRFPDFNASLAPNGESLIVKKYFHIGVAVNTEHGLVVPVIRDVDQKGLLQLARELQDAGEKARTRKLAMNDMQGGCFTISSLGGVGGTQFTPIVNVPEVAILGVSRASMQPVWDGKQFVPRLIMPFSLSFDHRVIDGVAGAQFTEHLRAALSDFRNVLL